MIKLTFPNGIKGNGGFATGDAPSASPAAESPIKAPAQEPTIYQKALDNAITRQLAQGALQQREAQNYRSPETLKAHAEELRTPTVRARVADTLKGAAKTYGAGIVNLGGAAAQGQGGTAMSPVYRAQAETLDQQIAALEATLSDPTMTERDIADTKEAIANAKAQRDFYQTAVRGGERAAGAVYGVADHLADSGAQDIQRAKKGLGKVGQLAVDVGVAGAQMGADIGAGILTGGGALAPMFVRSAGGGAQEARRSGATHEQQVNYGLASGALSVATEKIANVAAPFKKYFGGGFLDRAIDGALPKMNGSAAGKIALSFLSEGGEEVIEDLVQPALQMIYNGKSLGKSYSELEAAEILNDFLVGGILGGLGGGVEAIQQRAFQVEQQNTTPAQPAAAQESAQDTPEGNLTPAPETGAQGALQAQKSSPAQGAGYSRQRAGGPVAPSGVSATQESKVTIAPAAGESKRNPLDADTTTGGIDDAGQEARNNAAGAELADAGEGIGISERSGRRDAGTRAGEQAGGVEGGRPQRAAEQSGAAIERQNLARDLRLQKVSSAELGVRTGTDTKSVTVLPESAWDAELRDAAERIQRETGKKITMVLGAIPVRTKGGVQRVRGVWASGGIIIQADNLNVSASQIASHEIFHEYADQNPGLIQAVEQSIREKYSEEEFDRVLDAYIRKLRGIIDIPENAADYEVEQALLDIKNEIFADAYADINAFGEKAGKYQENVRQTLEDRGIVDTGRETAAATERRTGPPEKFSVEETDDGRAVAVVDDDILSGIDTQTWDKTKKAQAKAAAKAALLTFKDGIQVNGIDYKVSKRSRDEFTRSNETEKLYRKNKDAFADKMRAAANADDIITAATDWAKDGGLTHPRTGNLVDFAHGDVLIQSGDNQYDAKVVVGITGGGEYVFYDVVDMEPTSFAKKEETPTAASSGEALSAIHGVSSDDSISKGGENVKSLTFWEEVRRQIMGEEVGGAAKKDAVQELPQGVTDFGSLADATSTASDGSVSDGGGNVKPLTFWEDVRRQIMGEEEKASAASTSAGGITEGAKASGEVTPAINTAHDGSISEKRGNVKPRTFWEEVRYQIQGDEPDKQRYSAESDEFYERLDEELADRAAEEDRINAKKAAREKGIAAYSKPLIAKKELQKAVLDIFSVPVEDRDALRTTIDQYADSVIKRGKLTDRERSAFFNKMYESGIVRMEADEASKAAGQYVAHRKIYVPNEAKAQFGDSWNSFRKRAYAAGIYLTNDQSAIGVDAFNAELPEQLPTLFDPSETSERQTLERVVQLAEEGQAERMSLSEYIAQVAGKNTGYADRILDGLEGKLDQALQTFAEKAGLETELRSRSLRRELAERDRRIEMAQKKRENRELREMQQKTLKQLQWLSKNRSRAPGAMKEAWDEVLGDIDIYAASAANEMHWSKRHEATWGDLRDMYLEAKKGAEHGDPKYANFMPSKELQHIVDRLDNDKIADMDIDALKDLYKAAVELRTEFYNRNKVLNDEHDRVFEDVYTDAAQEIRNAPKGKKRGSTAGELFDELINGQQLSPMNIIQRMGGWDPNGALYSMAKQLESGERSVRDYTVKANRLLENFLNEHQDWAKKADGQGEDAIWYELEVPELIELGKGDKPIFGDTVKVYMTPAQKVHLYLESKNYDNLLHMTGGRTFVNRELYSKGKRSEALEQGTTVKLAPESVKKLVSSLTPEEAELARILERYYNDFAPKAINRVSNVLLGYDKAITKNYAPIYTNQNYTKSEFGVFDMSAEGVGNLKERKRSTTPSYNLSAFDAFEKHVEQTARYTGMAIPTRNMNTLLNWRGKDDSMRDVIAHEWGGRANKYIEDLVKEMQGEKSEKSTVAEIVPERVFSNYISAVFGFNPSIVLKQLGSIPMGSAYLGAKNFPSPKKIRSIDKKLISKYTQELAWRTMGYSMPETKQLKDNPNWTETNKTVNTIFGGGAITAMDGWAASILWPQAENKVRREHPELEIGTKEQIDSGESPFYQEVAREFNDAVARSQSTSDIIHQSTLRRSKNPIARAFTLFKSDSAQTYNAIRQKYGEWQYYKRSGAGEETLKKAKRGLGEAVLAALVNAVWSGTVTFLVAAVKNGAKRYRDDDDELTAESILKEFGMGLVGDLAGIMAGGEELSDIIGNGITGERWYRIEAPGLEQMNDMIEGAFEKGVSFLEHAGEFFNIIENKGDIGEFLRREGRDIAGWIREVAKDAATYLPGVPANNIEAYLLGTVRSLSPELAAAYEDAFMRVEKSDLSHLHGRTLTAKVRDLLKDRTGRDSKETAGIVAGLYDDGYTDAVPTATPSKVTIDKKDRELNAYQTQVYEKAWRKAIGGELDRLVTLNAFRSADDETQEKMLRRLYTYAGEMAKAAVFDDYEPKKFAGEYADAAKKGRSVAALVADELR